MLARQPLSISTLKLFLGLLVTFLIMGITDGWPHDYYLSPSEFVAIVALLIFPFFISRDLGNKAIFAAYGFFGALPVALSSILIWLRSQHIYWVGHERFLIGACLVPLGSAAACVFAAIAGSRFWRWWEPMAGFCSKCDYDLTANISGICPECGTQIPPQQVFSNLPLTPGQSRSGDDLGIPKPMRRLALRRFISVVNLMLLLFIFTLLLVGYAKPLTLDWSAPALNLSGGCRIKSGAIEIVHMSLPIRDKWVWTPRGVDWPPQPNATCGGSAGIALRGWRAVFLSSASYIPLWMPCFVTTIFAIAPALPTTLRPQRKLTFHLELLLPRTTIGYALLAFFVIAVPFVGGEAIVITTHSSNSQLLPFVGELLKIAGLPLAVALLIAGHRLSKPLIRLPALCLTCGYRFSGGVSGICPECGNPIKHPLPQLK